MRSYSIVLFVWAFLTFIPNVGAEESPEDKLLREIKEKLGKLNLKDERSERWTILFKTDTAKEYLEQLSHLKAIVVIPLSPDGKKNTVYSDLTKPNEGTPLKDQELPSMHFVDENRDMVKKVAEALGLKHVPPYFIVFFPKEVEMELAEKEKSYRNRKESEIYHTTFRVIQKDGKVQITVVDQIPQKK